MIALLTFAGCTDGSTKDKRISQPTDKHYTEKAVMDTYAEQLELALHIIDSAEMVGDLTAFHADLLRAVVYSRTGEDMKYDSAILIGEQLMRNDKVRSDAGLQEDVLELLLNACRMRKDYEQALHWATQLGELYRTQGEETEALRNDAEIGAFLIRIGQQTEGLTKIDSVIHQLDGKRKFNELDALIIALKRKAEICNEIGLYNDMILSARHMLDHLSDYEQHPDEFHDGTIREPADKERPGYIDFYRGKAYAYMAIAYAGLESSAESLKYLALYEQTTAGQSVTGRFMIAPALGKLGDYDRMLAIYDEVEQQLGTDTLNANYSGILRGRAETAEAQGRHADANGYWRRHADLTKLLNDQLLQSKAHLYAARYHAQEQENEIELHREAARRATISRTTIGFIGLLVFLFALYAAIQWRKTQRRNRILAQQITNAVEYKEKYKELKRSVEDNHSGELNAGLDGFSGDSGKFEIRPQEDRDLKTPTPESQIANPAGPTTHNAQLNIPHSTPLTSNYLELSDAELFASLRDLIEREKLFLNPHFERQTLIKRTGLSKERIGAAFAQGSGHERLTTLVRELRLDYAVRLMNEQPDLTVEQVCQASGFANADTFTRNFRAKYGMTPTAYRETKE